MLKIATIFLLTIINGCGNSHDDQTSATIGSLEELMNKNPELKKATLHQIKMAAEPQKARKLARSVAYLTDDSAKEGDLAFEQSKNNSAETKVHKALKEVALSEDLAKAAQKLIDEILDEYNVKNDFDAGLKVFAIFMKTQKAKMEEIRSLAAAKGDFVEFKADKWSDENNPFNATCEDMMAGNFASVALYKIGNMLDANKLNIKKSLSGCAKIHGEKFIDCMKLSMKMTNTINDNVTCELNDVYEMQSLIEQKSQMSFAELQDPKDECEDMFKKCGYIPETPAELMGEGTNREGTN